MLKRGVTSYWAPFPRFDVKAIQLLTYMLKRWEPLATLVNIWLILDLNSRPSAQEANVFQPDKPASIFEKKIWYNVRGCP